MFNDPSLMAGLLSAGAVLFLLRRAKVRWRVRALVAVVVYLAMYVAVDRIGWPIPTAGFSLVLVVAVVVNLVRFPYTACGGCDGNGKFHSTLSSGIRLCPACGGTGRQPRRARRHIENILNLPKA